jgi:hypothetical protein
MVVKSRAVRAQELSGVLTKVLDQETDDPIYLACMKTKINSVEILIDYAPTSIDTMTYDAADGFEADGTTPKFKTEDLLPEGHTSENYF